MKSLCTLFLAICLFSSSSPSQLLNAASARDELRFRALELGSNQRFLFVAYAPGDEDFRLIARARQSRGAAVHLAYLTNGEGRPDRVGLPYPNQIGARRREKAFAVAERADAGLTFLNLPFIDAASNIERVRAEWHSDTVRNRLEALIQNERPDGIFVTGFESFAPTHPILSCFLEDLSSHARQASRSRRWIPLQILIAEGYRRPNTSVSRSGQISDEVRLARELRGLSAEDAGEDRTFTYKRVDLKNGTIGPRVTASRLFARRAVPAALSSIDSTIRLISADLRKIRSMPSGKSRERWLIRLVDILNSVDLKIASSKPHEEEVRRFLLDWKLVLERIRSQILGVKVYWRLSESVVTDIQLTSLYIDSIAGVDPTGRTEVFFPATLHGWIVNESVKNHVPYEPGKEIRLLSPKDLPKDIPRAFEGLSREEFVEPWYFFVVHQASTAEYSFSTRVKVNIFHSVRFSAEVLTPIVRARKGERLAIRLTNHSRDGLKDSVFVSDARVASNRQPFRLWAKEQFHVDTLRLDWEDDIPEGGHLVDLLIGGEPVSSFLGRKFEVSSSPGRPVTVIGRKQSSALAVAVERLEYDVNVVAPEEAGIATFDPTVKILIDEDLHLDGTTEKTMWQGVERFIARGGRVVVFGQQLEGLSAVPEFGSMSFQRTFDEDSSYSIHVDTLNPLFIRPNDLREESWDGWLYRLASHRIESNKSGYETLASLRETGSPVILSRKQGSGSITYVDLNLSPQWMNVLPAAYRLLANLVEHSHDRTPPK